MPGNGVTIDYSLDYGESNARISLLRYRYVRPLEFSLSVGLVQSKKKVFLKPRLLVKPILVPFYVNV